MLAKAVPAEAHVLTAGIMMGMVIRMGRIQTVKERGNVVLAIAAIFLPAVLKQAARSAALRPEFVMLRKPATVLPLPARPILSAPQPIPAVTLPIMTAMVPA